MTQKEKQYLSQSGENYAFPLCAALDHGNFKLAMMLLENGSPMETEKCKLYGYPLVYAISSNDPELVKLLLMYDCRICLHSQSGEDLTCPWMAALEKRNLATLKIILECFAANGESSCSHRRISLYLAINKYNFFEAIRPLLEAKCSELNHQGHNVIDFMLQKTLTKDVNEGFIDGFMAILQYGSDIVCLRNKSVLGNIILHQIQLLRRHLEREKHQHKLDNAKPSNAEPFERSLCHALCPLPQLPQPSSRAEKVISILVNVGFVSRKNHFDRTNTWSLFCNSSEFSKALCHRALHVVPLVHLCRQVLRQTCGIYPQEKLQKLQAPKKILDFLQVKIV